MPLSEAELKHLESKGEVICPCLDNPDGVCDKHYCKCQTCREVKRVRAEEEALKAAQWAEENNHPTT